MVSIWHGRNSIEPFNVCKMCQNLCRLGRWKHLWDHCTWDLKNDLNLCYPRTWREVKSVRSWLYNNNQIIPYLDFHIQCSVVDQPGLALCWSALVWSAVMLLGTWSTFFFSFLDWYVLIQSHDLDSHDCLPVQQNHSVGNSIVPSICTFPIVLFLW